MDVDANAPLRFAASDVTAWFHEVGVDMIVGDAMDNRFDFPLSVGFARYRKGARNQIMLPYDEVLIIVRGILSVRRPDGVATAGEGEIIVHRAGTTVEYEATDDVEVVYVCHPALPLQAGGTFQPADHPLVEQFVPQTKK